MRLRRQGRTGGRSSVSAFRLLWFGESISFLGDALATLLIPLVAVLRLRGSALEVSSLTAANYLPHLVFGLPAGGLVDKLPVRRVMLACDVLQTVLFVGLGLLVAVGRLDFPVLLISAIIAGTSDLLFDAALNKVVVHFLSLENLVGGNSKLIGSQSVSRIAGPGLAGILVQVVGVASGMYANALSFLISFTCLVALGDNIDQMHLRPVDPPSHQALFGSGVKLVYGDPLLRIVTLWSTCSNFALAGYFALIVLYLNRVDSLPAVGVGLVMGAGGLAGVTGAVAARPVSRRYGTSRTLVTACAVSAIGGLLIPLSSGKASVALAVVGVFLIQGGHVLGSIMLASFRQGYVEQSALGRVSTSMRMFSYGVAPVGALVAGWIANEYGLRTGMSIVVAFDVASLAWFFCRPEFSKRDMPVRRAPNSVVRHPPETSGG